MAGRRRRLIGESRNGGVRVCASFPATAAARGVSFVLENADAIVNKHIIQYGGSFLCLTTRSATIMQALLSLSLALSDELDLQSLPDALLSKIMACMTTTEGRGLLLCCRRLSDLARPTVFHKRQREVRI